MKRIEVVQPALNQLLAFTLDGRRYALGLSAVERIVRMVEVTRVPGMPEIVMGVIDWQGKIIPVLNVRKRFALREREPDWNDHLIIARTSTRTVSLAVDSVTGVIARRSEEITPPETIAPGIGYVTGVTKLEGDILFVHDLDRFLSLQEEATLDEVRAGR